MNPAENVIAKFGGPAALAKMLGKGQTTISYWKKAGTIPAKWHAALLNLASEKGIALDVGDFVNAPGMRATSKRRSAASHTSFVQKFSPSARQQFFWSGGLILLLAVVLSVRYLPNYLSTQRHAPSTVAAASAPSPAQTHTEQSTSNATPAGPDANAQQPWFTYAAHKEWKTRCRQGADASTMGTMCVGLLDILDAQHARHVVLWVVGRNTKGGFVSNIQIPSGVMIAQGMTLQFNSGQDAIKTQHFGFSSCEPSGCLVRVAMDQDFLDTVRIASSAQVTAYSSEGRAVTFNIPIDGIGDVLTDLQ